MQAARTSHRTRELEELVRRNEKIKASGSGTVAALDNDLKTAALQALVPSELEQHIAMNRVRLITYEQARGEIQHHIEARRSQFAFKTVAAKKDSSVSTCANSFGENGGKNGKKQSGGKGGKKRGRVHIILAQFTALSLMVVLLVRGCCTLFSALLRIAAQEFNDAAKKNKSPVSHLMYVRIRFGKLHVFRSAFYGLLGPGRWA